MKLRYYLRGLGIGIVVTTIIMSFTRQPEKLTDTQIRERALELGMVEKNVLADLQKGKELNYENNDEESEGFEKVTEKRDESGERADDDSVSEVVENVKNEAAVNEAESEDETSMETEKASIPVERTEEGVERYIIVSVDGGSSSEVFSQKLFEAGVVDSAVEYNRFLIENGYARRLRAGNHEIPVGANHEEIAKILCGIYSDATP